MGVLNFVKGIFRGVGRKNLRRGARVVVQLDGESVRGTVLRVKEKGRRKGVRVQIAGGKMVVAKKHDVTVD